MNHEEKLYLLFIRYIGQDIDDKHIYEFLFGDEDQRERFWGEDFDQKPSCLCNEMNPLEDTYEEVHKVKTKFRLDLAQDSCCHSMVDCIDGIIALGWENIDDYDEYPEEGRIVFHFGDEFDEIEDRLARKGVLLLE